MYKTYIFDLDGTLLNTLGDLAASTNYALRQYGMPEHTIDDVRRFVGNGVGKLIERAIPELPLPHPSTFPKKQKRRPEKTFLVEKERAHKEVMWKK